MGVVGEIDRLGICAWSPAGFGGGYIACGTYAGAIDSTFASTSASLELLSVDIQGSKLTVDADCKTSERFSSIAWSYPLHAHKGGLIAGGLCDGTVRVWDAAALIRARKGGDDMDKCVVAGGSNFPQKHQGAVRGVCFNPFSPHMLASGGADSTVNIWDLSNLGQGPSVRPPSNQQVNPSPSEEVCAIQWNLRVSHIVGSGTAGGVLRIWDLRQRRQVISIPSPGSRMRCSGIHWHPEIPTQVMTTCNQDNGFGALLWDLRGATQPIVTFNNIAHRGVTSASWCGQDSEMILVSTTEPRNLIVSSKTGELLCDLQAQPSASFDVQWSPRIPGLYLTSTVDSNLTIRSLLTSEVSRSVSVETVNALAESFGEMASGFDTGFPAQSPKVQANEKKSVNIQRPPKWLRRPVSIAFGRSGRYAFVSGKGEGKVTVAPHKLKLQGLKERLFDLDEVLKNANSADPRSVEVMCRDAAKSSELKEDVMGFEVLALLFQENPRMKLLKYLGFDVEKVAESSVGRNNAGNGLPLSAALAVPLRTEESDALEANGNTEVGDSPQADILGHVPIVSGPAPWDDVNLQSDSILDDAETNGNEGASKYGSKPKAETGNEFEGMTKSTINVLIRNSIIMGNISKAVDACLFSGRMADALVLARAGGPSLWYRAHTEYLSSLESQGSSNVISAVAGSKAKLQEFLSSVNGQSKDAWKEALAVVLTYVPGPELSESCTALGNRLLGDGRDGPALVCFICAGNTQMAISTWKGEAKRASQPSRAMEERVVSLSSSVRKVRLLTAAVLFGSGEADFGSVRCLDEVSGSILCEYAGLLALSGEADVAASYVSNLNADVQGPYGSPSDIFAMASSEQSANSSAPIGSGMPQAQSNSGYSAFGYGPYGGTYFEQAPVSNVTNWSHQQPAIPSPMNGTLGAQAVQPPPPAPISLSKNNSQPQAQIPAQPSHATRSQVADRGMFDPSVYSAPMNFSTPSYAAPAQAMPPAPPASITPIAPPAPIAAQPTMTQVPPVPSMPTSPPVPLAGPTATALGVQGALSPNFPPTSMNPAPMQTMQAMPAPPPPPPSTDAAQMPKSYHANARPGSGQSLPPSAEVAVFEERRSKAMSQAATHGTMPRRSQSNSSSLSSMSNEPVPVLEKVDPSSVSAEHQIIVKSLRNAYAHAVKRSTSTMYRKKMEDINKKLGRLVASLGKGSVDPNVVPLLVELTQFMDKGKFDSASGVVATLMHKYWDSNSQWIQALKRLCDSILHGR